MPKYFISSAALKIIWFIPISQEVKLTFRFSIGQTSSCQMKSECTKLEHSYCCLSPTFACT